mmetsp:Transcript_9016/g.28346  ORF Transcript_9016/g.28346 Transcript_9016/m.28346 type:complete len:200 (-) Transcript_9016:333-932(-)
MSMRTGSSMYFLNAPSHCAPMAPSITRWSDDSVTVMKLASLKPPLPSATTRFSAPPIARMAACGGLIIAVKCLTPNMPRLETVNVPPWNSSGLSLLARARAASSLVSAAICARPFVSARAMIGVIRPLSVETATQTSAWLYVRTKSSCHAALTWGTSRSALAAALTMKSFTDTLRSLSTASLTFVRSRASSSRLHSIAI